MHEGDFEIEGRTFYYEVLHIETTDGEDYSGADMDAHIREADRVFYSAEAEDGERFYRWLGGPFEDFSEVENAIADEAEEYA